MSKIIIRSTLTLVAAAALIAGLYRFARSSKRAVGEREQRGLEPQPQSPALSTEPITGERAELDSARISSAPDLLAEELGDPLGGEVGAELTAQPNERVPAPHTGDDEDAPAPEDLGRAWLMQATESESSYSSEALVPDVENVAGEADELADANEALVDPARDYVQRTSSGS